MEQQKINSLSAYVDFVMKQRNSTSVYEENSSSMWFFRGQKSAQWAVLPSIFRNDRLSVEHNVIEDAIRHNPFEFRNLSEFEMLTKLQHYGLGTRLLDITFNPFVALFFATDSHEEYIKGKNNQYSQHRHDGVVYYGFKPWHATSEL